MPLTSAMSSRSLVGCLWLSQWVVCLLMVFSTTASFISSPLKQHQHLKHQQLQQKNLPAIDSGLLSKELSKDEYEEVLSAIQHELFTHSDQKDVSKSAPCMETIDKNATMIKSIGRSSKGLVDVDASQKFEIAYCSSEGESFCAVDSTCATIYRWKKAKVHREIMAGSGLEFTVHDEILVPQGCTCVINSFKSGLKSNLPIIIF